MTWDPGRVELVGCRLSPQKDIRIALRVPHLALCILGTGPANLGKGSAPNPELTLDGRTFGDALRWASEQIHLATGGVQQELMHPGFQLPEHPLGRGERFQRDPGLAELARWYGNADGELRRVAKENPSAGPVLCWPHHFDIATLIEVEPPREGRPGRTLGAGLSPGDLGIDEPYFYVSHWPPTRSQTLPPLEVGEWIRVGWVGAALRGSLVTAAQDSARQTGLVHAFFSAAIPASRSLAFEAPLP
jgi:hypothetical protein